MLPCLSDYILVPRDFLRPLLFRTFCRDYRPCKRIFLFNKWHKSYSQSLSVFAFDQGICNTREYTSGNCTRKNWSVHWMYNRQLIKLSLPADIRRVNQCIVATSKSAVKSTRKTWRILSTFLCIWQATLVSRDVQNSYFGSPSDIRTDYGFCQIIR